MKTQPLAGSLLQLNVSAVQLLDTQRLQWVSGFGVPGSSKWGAATCAASAACLVAAILAECFRLRLPQAYGEQKTRLMQAMLLLLMVISAADMTILVPVIYDLSVQLHYGATVSGVLLGAYLASQPLGTILGGCAASPS